MKAKFKKSEMFLTIVADEYALAVTKFLDFGVYLVLGRALQGIYSSPICLSWS